MAKKPPYMPTRDQDSSNILFAGEGPKRSVKKHDPDGMWESSFRYEHCHKLVEHMSQGYSFYSFASEVGVLPRTLDRWVHKHEPFKEAKEIGEAHALRFWEEQGIRGLHMGKNFNSIIWIFNMKNRFRKFGWRDKWAEDDGSGPINIGTAVNISTGELTELIKMARDQQQELERVTVDIPDRKAVERGVDRSLVSEEEPVGCLPAPEDAS